MKDITALLNVSKEIKKDIREIQDPKYDAPVAYYLIKILERQDMIIQQLVDLQFIVITKSSP